MRHFGYYFSFINFGFGILFGSNKVLNFPCFWEMRNYNKYDSLFIRFYFILLIP